MRGVTSADRIHNRLDWLDLNQGPVGVVARRRTRLRLRPQQRLVGRLERLFGHAPRPAGLGGCGAENQKRRNAQQKRLLKISIKHKEYSGSSFEFINR
jgi:hypothetical protein